jgi:hypothetical protein
MKRKPTIVIHMTAIGTLLTMDGRTFNLRGISDAALLSVASDVCTVAGIK